MSPKGTAHVDITRFEGDYRPFSPLVCPDLPCSCAQDGVIWQNHSLAWCLWGIRPYAPTLWKLARYFFQRHQTDLIGFPGIYEMNHVLHGGQPDTGISAGGVRLPCSKPFALRFVTIQSSPRYIKEYHTMSWGMYCTQTPLIVRGEAIITRRIHPDFRWNTRNGGLC
jgi:hypothetical protein